MNRGAPLLSALIDNARALAGFPRRPDDGNKKADVGASASEGFQMSFDSNRNDRQKSTTADNVHSRSEHSRSSNPAFDIPLRKTKGQELIHVNADLAQHWLGFNTTNRKINAASLERYKADMESGKWRYNAEPIKFAYRKLLDGQTRLTALSLTGTKLQFLVAYGLDEESQVTMDTGRGRSSRDVLSMESLDTWESTVAGSAIHGLISVAKGGLPSAATRYTNQEVRNFFLEHNADVRESLRVLKALPRRPLVIRFSVAATLHYLFAVKDKELADTFFQQLLEPDGLSSKSPIAHLRNMLMSDQQRLGKHRSAYETMKLTINAWNGFRRNAQWRGNTSLHGVPGFPEIK